MKHIIMGTAGHIDHGKTALIKALTDIDCDTHKEEKRRGITINLGFAHLDLPSGDSIGIVDVPGHKDFVHTMVGGASGIDFVLMVIAADSGIMPQTREHLQIMEVLGVKHGLIALTKIDLIDDQELFEILKADIEDFVKGTLFENSPVIDVSAKTGEGLEKLKTNISDIVNNIEDRSIDGIFRINIDRIFSISGFGTVVTGSVTSGSVGVKDTVYLLPGGKKELSIRRLERHGKEVSEVIAGDRASINLAGLEKSDFKKGMIISDRILKETKMLDANLELFKENPGLKLWSQVIFHSGTYEGQAKIHLIDRNKLNAGETGLVQILLKEPCVLQHGDRFVIRNSSSDRTLGGGEVIDIAPLHHRRRPEKLIKEMSAIAKGKLSEQISAEVRKIFRAVSSKEIAFNLNISPEEIKKNIQGKLPRDILRFDIKDKLVFISKDALQKIRKGVMDIVREFKNENPLSDRGVTLGEITGKLKIEKGSETEDVLKEILNDQVQIGKLYEKDKSWMPADGMSALSREMENHVSFFSEYLKGSGMKTPLMSDLKIQAEKRNLSHRELKQILYYLKKSGQVYRVEDEYIHASIVDSCREKLKEELSRKKEGITVAGFRDLVKGNRKICLLLFAQYDSEKLTRRVGDLRILACEKK